jgi:hypothetical protein
MQIFIRQWCYGAIKKNSRWRINAKTIVDIIKYDKDNPFKVLDVGALK